MTINHIVRYNLESRTKALKEQGKSFDIIADTLTRELKASGSDIKITSSCVKRYFYANETMTSQIIEKSEKLQNEIIKVKLDTELKRHELFDRFIKLADKAANDGDYNAAQNSLKGAKDTLRDLDERLGDLKTGNTFNFLTIKEQVDASRSDLTGRINSIASRLGERTVLPELDGPTDNRPSV